MMRFLRIARLPAVVIVIGLLVLAADGSEVAAAQLFAVAAILLVTFALFSTGRKRPVALRPFEYRDEHGDKQRVDAAGLEVPAEALKQGRENVDYKLQHGLFFRGLILGKDGRWSTSKLQVLLWTYALLFALASIFVAKALGVDEGLESLNKDKQDWDVYLILLGGPFAAFVLAQGITGAKVEGQTVAKTPSEPTTTAGQGLSEVISNDAGETDIVDLQYFLFNLLALGYFLISFASDLVSGLPELPELLVALTGTSAATYVAKKAIEQKQPSITAVLPTKARTGGTLDIWGHWLVLGEPSREDRKPRISIGSMEVPKDDVRIVNDTGSGVDHLRCTVPKTAEPGEDTIRIVTAAGVTAESPLEVESGVRIRAVSVGKIQLTSGGDITLRGENFGPPDAGAAVLLDEVPLAIQEWTEDVIRARLDDERLGRGAYAQNQQAKLTVQDAAGQRSKPWTLPVE